MAEAYRHVRFRLSQLTEQVGRHCECGPVTNQDALEFYWQWARGRGWHLVAVASRVEPDYVLQIWDGDQLELRRDETWDVVWKSEDVIESPDFLKSEELAARAAELERSD